MLNSLLSSLQFRLIVGFAAVLTATLAGVSLYIGNLADREAAQLNRDVQEVRRVRVERVISNIFSSRPDQSGLQVALEQASSLYGWRIVVNDPHGRMVADSHLSPLGPLFAPPPTMRRFDIRVRGSPVAAVWVDTEFTDESEPEPPPKRLADELNRSLIWAGLAAGVIGVGLVALLSRGVLTPVRALIGVARLLGSGDLSHRVDRPGHDEIGELGRTFNSMAEGLEHADRQRRDLMADVAHELRTPLSNIQGYLEAVRDGVVEADSQTIDTIYQQALHLSHLVEDLRVLALAESGALRLELSETSVDMVLRESAEAFLPRAQAKEITIELRIDGGLPDVVADRARITQVAGNLIDNAITHTPEGGMVEVTGERAGDAVRVTVSDTGAGIPAEDLKFIFERLYRVDPSRSRATGATGLGLTIARQLVEAHRGSIRAETTLGQGSRFIFELPLRPPPITKSSGT